MVLSLFGTTSVPDSTAVDCPMCGTRRDFFRLTEASTWWRMDLTSNPGVWVGTKPPRQSAAVHRYHICRRGHIWPAGLKLASIHRILGTTAAGKTMLLRNLARQTVDGVRLVMPPTLCWSRFDAQPHPGPTVERGTTHRVHLTDFMGTHDAAPAVLDDLLARSGLSPDEVEEFGKDLYLPLHLLVQDDDGLQDTVFVDLAGEVTEGIVGQAITDQVVAQLSESDGVVWVVDGALLPQVQTALQNIGKEDILLESMRPELFIGPWRRNRPRSDIQKALDEALGTSADRFALTVELADLFAKSSQTLGPNVLRAVVLSKADLIPHLLAVGGWQFLEPIGVDEAAYEVAAGGIEYLESLAANLNLPLDPAATDLLSWLRSASPEDRGQRCEAIVGSVLDFYSDAARFKQLALDNGRGRPQPGGVLHQIHVPGVEGGNTRIVVTNIRTGWTAYRTSNPRELQQRDIVVGILVRSILGLTPMADHLRTAEGHSPVRYFLTGPMDAANQVVNPIVNTAIGRNSGVLHLLAWVMA